MRWRWLIHNSHGSLWTWWYWLVLSSWNSSVLVACGRTTGSVTKRHVKIWLLPSLRIRCCFEYPGISYTFLLSCLSLFCEDIINRRNPMSLRAFGGMWEVSCIMYKGKGNQRSFALWWQWKKANFVSCAGKRVQLYGDTWCTYVHW